MSTILYDEVTARQQALEEYADQKKLKLSKMSLRCTSCDRLRKGITVISTGKFLCIECILKKKIKGIIEDPDFIKLERKYMMREAVSKYKAKNAIDRYKNQNV